MTSPNKAYSFFGVAGGGPRPEPYLLPPNFPTQLTQTATPEDWFAAATPGALLLPLQALTGSATTNGVPLSPGNPIFELTADASKSALVSLHVSAATIASPQLASAFRTFLTQVEALTPDQLLPGAAAVIAQAVASALPLPYAQILPLTYGFDSGLTSGIRGVDLRPGMRLRVDTAPYQFAAPGPLLNGRNGYAAAGTQVYHLQASADGFLGLDPFIDGFAAMSTLTPSGGTPQWVASGADLALSGARFRFLRLIYPAQLDDVAPTGGPVPGNSPAIVGANDRASLDAACAAWTSQAALPPGTAVFVFSGRTFATPEICIFLNGVHDWVPLGTTLGTLFSRAFAPPPMAIDGWGAAIPPEMHRWAWKLRTSNEAASFAWASIDFHLAGAPGAAWADLPLVGGDSLALAAAP